YIKESAIMNISKTEITSVITVLDQIYSILSTDKISHVEFSGILPKLANFCIQIHPLFNKNFYFIELFNYAYKLLSDSSHAQNGVEDYESKSELYKNMRYKLLSNLERFEHSLIKQMHFHLYLQNCKAEDLPINNENVESLEEFSMYEELLDSTSFLKENAQDFSVLIYSGQQQQEVIHSDFYFHIESVMNLKNTLSANLNQLDYYKRDRIYLEAKLESLKKRQDIRLLLAGSSYTMCGLFENQMPLPSRNIAIDAQDLYYSMISVRTALDYNPNITHCILSFAYYFWGYDLSLSTSLYQYKRVTEVNYPVFKDKHNFSGVLEDRTQTFLTSITPLKKHLFSFEKLLEQQIEKLKESFEDAHYFPYPRVGSAVLKNDEQTNHQLAQKRAASHNKFFKYQSTVEENKKLFADFLEEMNSKGVQIILFVPPVTEYYRNYINPDLISNFYECMEPLKSKFQFTLIDLFNSDQFESGDFYDYDHLNDRGAKKLGKILGKELDI
ncbi:hypothetical protein P5F75_17930, partial [Caldifermentibacillus hisashii]|uniref:hypothetical protein n=1 Tax=Caldifermentibacillus hisashii TaxID=996558 RepID=UPI002E1A628D|nr:hypothetical protein [Caldifermentibacillus hisashii]